MSMSMVYNFSRLLLLLQRARLRNFNFDEWKKRYMDWMNHNKTRVMDFFRRIDKDRDGKVSRTEFVNGILQSSKLLEGGGGGGVAAHV